LSELFRTVGSGAEAEAHRAGPPCAPRTENDPAAPARAAPARASAVAEAEPAAATPVEKTGPAFGALKDIEAIQEVLPHRCAPALAPLPCKARSPR